VYTQVESEYIKHKKRTVSWINRSYVDDLITLAKFIRNHPHGLAANMHFYQLRNRYPGDHLELLREHPQEEYNFHSGVVGRPVEDLSGCAAKPHRATFAVGTEP
jgi:hypothetical protein